MLTRRFVLTGLIAAPAVIAADKLMPVHSLPKPYATVWGVGWDLEVVEHVVWTQQDALRFANFSYGGINKFREITDIVYGFKMPPLPTVKHHIYQMPDPMVRFDRPVDDSRGLTNITTYGQLNAWRESLRPDLDGRLSVEWIQEQIKAERKILGS
jgi:hypothetical protein